MTSVTQSTTDGDDTKTSGKTTYTSTIQVAPGLSSRTTTSFIDEEDTNFPFEPLNLPPPSTFFDPFFRTPQPRLFPSLFDARRNSRAKRRSQLEDYYHPSSGYNSSNSSSSIKEPIYEFPSSSSDSSTTPINSPNVNFPTSFSPTVDCSNVSADCPIVTSPVPSTASSNDTVSSSKSFKESLIRVLDEVDARVRFLRATANELEEEKEKLLNTLSSLEKRNELSMIEESKYFSP